MSTEFDKLKKRFKGKSVRPKSEVSVESYLFKQVRRAGFRAVKFEDPSYDGGPDRIILGPGAFVMFVETKTDVGKLSPNQKGYIKELRSQGYEVQIIRTRTEVDLLVDYLRFVRASRDLGL